MKFQDYQNLTRLGKLKTRRSTQIATSRLGVGFETLDRDMWDANQAWPVLDALGVKWARVQSGWAKTEKAPGEPPVMAECPAAGVGFPPIHTPKERAAWQAYVRGLASHIPPLQSKNKESASLSRLSI